MESQTQSRPLKRDMTKGPILPHVFRMAFPMAVGIGAIISFSIADMYFIGQLGPTELAAISFTIPITTLFFNLIFGLAIAMSAVVSRKIGAGLRDEVRITATIGIAMAVILSTFCAIIGYTMIEPIFIGLGAGDATMPFIREYMPIWLFGAIFLSIPVVANSAIRGTGDALWPALVMIIVAVVNIILDPILIFGLLGAPALGVKGAAIASTIAYIVAAIVALSILGGRERLLAPLCMFASSSWRLVSKPLLVIAIPVSLGNVIAPIIVYGYTNILADLGNGYVAGYGVASRLEAFILIPIMAVAGGISPLIGQNFGAGLQDRVSEALRKSITFAIAYAVFSAIILYIVSDGLAEQFSDDAIAQGFATAYLAIVPLSYVGLYVFAVITSAMNATGFPKHSLVINIVKSFVISLPLAYVMTNAYGADGFLWSVVISNLIGLIMVLFYVKRIRCTS
jgi:putative MATE family efflux protein